jgi:hypothetical protein
MLLLYLHALTLSADALTLETHPAVPYTRKRAQLRYEMALKRH